MRGAKTFAALFMSFGLILPAWAQNPEGGLEDAKKRAEAILARAKSIEANRLEMMRRVIPAVASVFPEGVGKGGGSGVIIHPRGYLLTNFHVVEVHREVSIGLSDGEVYKADVLAIDPTGDIALVRVRGKKEFPFVPMGNSDQVQVGERVYAMGNPFLLATDFKPTITEGIVSGVHRFRGEGTTIVYGDCIQTDAAINPGNSGGPLFNSRGELVGINGLGGFRQERGRFNVGVGYAASMNQIRNFIGEMRAGGQVQHGQMGATVADRPDPADPLRTILQVDQIYDDSVAYSAGLRLGDEILKFNGLEIRSQNQFLTLLSRLPAGFLVQLEVQRREGQKIGARERVGFRLAVLPGGPKEGDYKRLENLAAEELDLVLADFKAANKAGAVSFARSGLRKLADGTELPLREVQSQGRRWLALGLAETRRVEASDGKVLRRRDSDGALHEDSIGDEIFASLAAPWATISALFAGTLKEHAEKLVFEGGEAVSGRFCLRLGVTDKSAAYCRLYIDWAEQKLVGFASPDESGDSYLETIFEDWQEVGGSLRPMKSQRRRWSDGSLLWTDVFNSYAEAPDGDYFSDAEKLAPEFRPLIAPPKGTPGAGGDPGTKTPDAPPGPAPSKPEETGGAKPSDSKSSSAATPPLKPEPTKPEESTPAPVSPRPEQPF